MDSLFFSIWDRFTILYTFRTHTSAHISFLGPILMYSQARAHTHTSFLLNILPGFVQTSLLFFVGQQETEWLQNFIYSFKCGCERISSSKNSSYNITPALPPLPFFFLFSSSPPPLISLASFFIIAEKDSESLLPFK